MASIENRSDYQVSVKNRDEPSNTTTANLHLGLCMSLLKRAESLVVEANPIVYDIEDVHDQSAVASLISEVIISNLSQCSFAWAAKTKAWLFRSAAGSFCWFLAVIKARAHAAHGVKPAC